MVPDRSFKSFLDPLSIGIFLDLLYFDPGITSVFRIVLLCYSFDSGLFSPLLSGFFTLANEASELSDF